MADIEGDGSGGGEATPESLPDINTMLVAQLRKELSSRGIDTKGKKAELVERLKVARADSKAADVQKSSQLEAPKEDTVDIDANPDTNSEPVTADVSTGDHAVGDASKEEAPTSIVLSNEESTGGGESVTKESPTQEDTKPEHNNDKIENPHAENRSENNRADERYERNHESRAKGGDRNNNRRRERDRGQRKGENRDAFGRDRPRGRPTSPQGPRQGHDRRQTESPPPNCRLFLGNLPSERITKPMVEKVFSKYGAVLEVVVLKSFGFVQYNNPRSAQMAIQGEDKKMFAGMALDISLASNKGEKKSRHNDRDRTQGQICRDFVYGKCTRGDRCKFSHGNPKTKIGSGIGVDGSRPLPHPSGIGTKPPSLGSSLLGPAPTQPFDQKTPTDSRHRHGGREPRDRNRHGHGAEDRPAKRRKPAPKEVEIIVTTNHPDAGDFADVLGKSLADVGLSVGLTVLKPREELWRIVDGMSRDGVLYACIVDEVRGYRATTTIKFLCRPQVPDATDVLLAEAVKIIQRDMREPVPRPGPGQSGNGGNPRDSRELSSKIWNILGDRDRGSSHEKDAPYRRYGQDSRIDKRDDRSRPVGGSAGPAQHWSRHGDRHGEYSHLAADVDRRDHHGPGGRESRYDSSSASNRDVGDQGYRDWQRPQQDSYNPDSQDLRDHQSPSYRNNQGRAEPRFVEQMGRRDNRSLGAQREGQPRQSNYATYDRHSSIPNDSMSTTVASKAPLGSAEAHRYSGDPRMRLQHQQQTSQQVLSPEQTDNNTYHTSQYRRESINAHQQSNQRVDSSHHANSSSYPQSAQQQVRQSRDPRSTAFPDYPVQAASAAVQGQYRPTDPRLQPGSRPVDPRLQPGSRPVDPRLQPGSRPADPRLQPGSRPADPRLQVKPQSSAANQSPSSYNQSPSSYNQVQYHHQQQQQQPQASGDLSNFLNNPDVQSKLDELLSAPDIQMILSNNSTS